MKTLTFYLNQENIIYFFNSEKGVINKKDAAPLLEKLKGGVLNVIVSKPEMIFRRIEVPFTSVNKVMLILPQELEELLPESPSNFYYHFEFYRMSGGKTSVNIYAIKDTIYHYWQDIAKKQKLKLFFFSDATIFTSVLNQQTSKKNYIGIYALQDYVLVNVIEKGQLIGSYSFADKQTGKMKDMLKTILSVQESFLFFLGHEEVKNELRDILRDAQDVKCLLDIDKSFFFPCIVNNNAYRIKPLNLRKLTVKEKVPVSIFFYFFFFVVVSILSFSPYFRLSEKEKYRDDIIRQMKETFRIACPDVTRIVDPLVQIKEKIAEKTTRLDTISGYPSVLKVMADVTSLFPETIDVEIEQFTIASNNVTIVGRIESLKALEEVKNKVSASKKFNNMTIGAISFDEKNRVSFNMTLGIIEHE